MVKASKENIIAAVMRALTERVEAAEVTYLTDGDNHDITNTSDHCLVLVKENNEIVVKDVYPGRIYARIVIEAKWTFGD